VILLEGGLSRLASVFRLGDQAMGRVRQGLGVVILPNAVAIALGALGRIDPPTAAIVNNGATVLAVLVGALPLLNAPRRRDLPAPIGARPPGRAVRRQRAPASATEDA
jgi:cation transport ATPase